MAVIRRDAIIGASADTVFRIVEDPANWPRYVPHVSRALDIHPSEPRIGDTFRLLYGFLGIRVDEKLTVTEYEVARVYNMRVDGHMSGTQRWTFEARDSHTTVTVDVDYHLPGGVLGRVLDRLFLRRFNERTIEQMFRNLDDLASTHSADPESARV